MIKITKRGFSSILNENDKKYLGFITDALLAHSDPNSEIFLDKIDNTIRVSIKPSEQAFKSHIIQDLISGHRLIGMKIHFSKSLAVQKTIYYYIEF